MAKFKQKQKRTEPPSVSRPYPKAIRLLIKQLIASLVCGLLFFLMHTLPVIPLNNCADALGRALRYDYKLPTQKLTDWVKERIPLP